jgi:hypothetical protein
LTYPRRWRARACVRACVCTLGASERCSTFIESFLSLQIVHLIDLTRVYYWIIWWRFEEALWRQTFNLRFSRQWRFKLIYSFFVTPCSVVGRIPRFKGPCSLHLQGEVVSTLLMSIMSQFIGTQLTTPATYPMGTRGYFSGGKAAGAWSWSLNSILVPSSRMRGATSALLQYVFMACCSFKKKSTWTALPLHRISEFYTIMNYVICWHLCLLWPQLLSS